MAAYHASPRGNDANPGTVAKPWKTLDRANRAVLRPGDRLLFEGGRTFAGTLSLRAKGTAQARITIGSYGKGRATLDGGNGSAVVAQGCRALTLRDLTLVGAGRKTGNTASGLLLEGGRDVTVDQVEVTGFRDSGLLVTGVTDARITHVHAHLNGAAGLAASGPAFSRNLYIGHCLAENNPGSPVVLEGHSGNGIVVGSVKDCTIEYCEASNNGWDMPWRGNGPVGIWAWNADRVVIQHCFSHGNKSPGHDGGGFDFDGGVTNSVLQYNYSCNNVGAGYLLCQYTGAAPWKNNVVRYNLSVNDGWKDHKAGIFVAPLDVGVSNCDIYHNTVYNALGSAVAFLGTYPAPGIRFRNNLFVSAEELIAGDPGTARFEGNCYWSLTDSPVATGGLSFEDWLATGQERRGRTVLGRYADPRLTDAGTSPALAPTELRRLQAYRLRAGSPCLGAGLPLRGSGGRDLWGKAVPARPDLGAHQRG